MRSKPALHWRHVRMKPANLNISILGGAPGSLTEALQHRHTGRLAAAGFQALCVCNGGTSLFIYIISHNRHCTSGHRGKSPYVDANKYVQKRRYGLLINN